MPQAVQIETQAERKSLTLLHWQGATGSSRRELAFDGAEQALDRGAAAIEPEGKLPPHLCPHPMDVPVFLPPLGRNYAVRPELLPDVGVIPPALSNSTSASTSPIRVCWEAVRTTAGRFARSFHGPRRAI
jgi:hypothetical protein